MRWLRAAAALLIIGLRWCGPPASASNTFTDEATNLSSDFLPDDGEPAPNIEEYSSILSNYEDYDADTNSSAVYEADNVDVLLPKGNRSSVIRFVRQLNNVTRDSGKSVKMNCEVTGEPPPLRIRWYMNEVQVGTADAAPPGGGAKKSPKPRLTVKRFLSKHKNGLGSRLRINRLEVHDSGFFTCEATNGIEKIQSTAILMVKVNPFGHDESNVDVPQFGFSNQHPVILEGETKLTSHLGLNDQQSPLESIPELSQILPYPRCQRLIDVNNSWMTPLLLKSPEDNLPDSWLSKRSFPEELEFTYELLQRVAVGFEMLVEDAKKYKFSESFFLSQFVSCKNDLRQLLCETSDGIDITLQTRPVDVPREIIPNEVKNEESSATRNLTNSIIFRDYMIAIKYILNTYGEFKQRFELFYRNIKYTYALP